MGNWLMPTAYTYAADWQSRIAGPSVVKHYKFDSVDEVNNWRWRNGFGQDPNDLDLPGYTRHSSSGGLAGGVLEIQRDAGTTDPGDWWIPLAPCDGDSNGLGVDDPAASGSLTLRSFDPYGGSSVFQNFGDYGYYGHTDYHTGDVFDGTEFYLQFRCKRPSGRFNLANPDGGKILFVCTNKATNVHQTHVLQAAKDGHNSIRLVGMYNHYDGGANPYESQMGAGTYGYQPGNACGYLLDGLCDKYDTDGKFSNCFLWPLDEWCTVMFHHRPGHDGSDDGLSRLFIAPWGHTEFIRIMNCDALTNGFTTPSGTLRYGVNAIALSAYSNGAQQTMSVGFVERFTEVIVSQDWIPCPTVYL